MSSTIEQPCAVGGLEEQIRFGRGARLSGVLGYPHSRAPECAVLLCSPHPNFAGDMDNNVIRGLAQSLSLRATTLRFDYRGIGQSRIDLPPGQSALDYWDRIELAGDYLPAIEDTHEAVGELARFSGGLPMVAIGYSFGALAATLLACDDPRLDRMVGIAPPLQRIDFTFLAHCPKPCLLVSGQDDFTFSAELAQQLRADAGPNLRFDEIPGMDHFFRDAEQWLADRVADFIWSSTR